MENINFSLNEIEINKPELDLNILDTFVYENMYDIEQLKIFYDTHFTIKSLSQILQYYNIQKNKIIQLHNNSQIKLEISTYYFPEKDLHIFNNKK